MRKKALLHTRGELRDHVLSIIIGIVALGLMLYAAWILMQAYLVNDHDRAVDALQTIERKLNALDEGAYTRFPLQGPEGWYLQGWSVTDVKRPERCYFKSCICVCKEAGVNGAASCQDSLTGTCIFVKEQEVQVEYQGAVKQSVGIEAVSGEGAILPFEGRCPVVPFEKNLLEITLYNELNRVVLTHQSKGEIDGDLCKR